MKRTLLRGLLAPAGLCFGLSSSIRPAFAQTVSLVKDLVTTADSSIALLPANLAAVGGSTFFAGSGEGTGVELWKSDGTSGGTVLVKDIWPGAGSSSPSDLVAVGSVVYFFADDGASGRELWKSDGTPGGTTMVKDINPGSGSAYPSSLVVSGGVLYFSAYDSAITPRLWRSDGTAGGTRMVVDPCGSSCPTSVSALADVGGTLYFTASGGGSGQELWKSDGTTAGTVMVKDICAGSCSSSPWSLTRAGATLFFTADDGVNGRELWKSDGTAAGTALVKDVQPGVGGSSPTNLVAAGSTLFFLADDGTNGRELWKSDGAAGATILLKDLNPGSASANIGGMTGMGGLLLFSGQESTNGRELWKSDGTPAGTVLLKDICPGAGCDGDPQSLLAVGSTLFFSANDGVTGTELWKSDGTTGGTLLVSDVCAGGCGSYPTSLSNAGGTLTFRGAGGELWKSDGSAAGTTIVKDVTTLSSFPSSFVEMGGALYFVASDGASGRELYRSDGTGGGTAIVLDIGPGDGVRGTLVKVGSTLFFAANDNTNETELWKSDGTPGGTSMVKDVCPGGCASTPGSLAAVGSTVFFSANDGMNGRELWKSDGTGPGTVLVKDIRPGGWSDPANLVAVGGTLFFTANDGANGTELWRSDGSPAGTVMLKDLCPGACSSNPASLVNANGTLFFRAFSNAAGWELWKSDGTPVGTTLVRDLCAGSCSSYPNSLTGVGSTVLFSAWGPDRELWKSDGTAAGTIRVKDICPGPCESSPAGFLAAGNRLFFRADDGTNGMELWVTDGTESGTTLARDIAPGAASSIPRPVRAFGSWVLYAASDGTSGEELWKSDGTAVSTFRLQDLNPGSGHSNVTEALLVGTRLLLNGDDGTSGNELRSVPQIDLAVTLADAPDPVAQGNTLTYSATVTNQGTLTATSVRFSLALPAGTSFLSASGPSCSLVSGSVICYLGTMAPAASTGVTVQVAPSAGSTGTLAAVARASAMEADVDPPDDFASVTTVVSGPQPARELQAMTRSSSAVDLRWVDPQGSETGFRLERSSDGVTFTPFDIVGANVTTYTDSGRAAATLYYYRVVALESGAGESAPSNVAAATTFASSAAKVCGSLLGAYHGTTATPSVAWNGSDWAMAWSDKRDGANSEIWFQRLASATGAPASAAVRVTTSGTSTSNPTLRWNGTAYGLLFTEGLGSPAAPSPSTLRFALLDANGAKLRGDVVLGATGNRIGGQDAALVWNGSGWGVFLSVDPAPPSQLRYMRLDADGDLVGSAIDLPGTSDWELFPSVAWNGTEYGVAWVQSPQDLLSYQFLFQRFALDGTPIGSPAIVSERTGIAYSFLGVTSIVWDGSSWVVAFVDGLAGPVDAEAIYLRRLAADGTPAGAAVRLSHDLEPGTPPEDMAPVYDESPVLFQKPGGGFVVFTTSFPYALINSFEVCRYEADASLARVGSRTVLSTFDGRNSMRGRAATDGTRYLIAWGDARSGTPEITDVLVDAQGATLSGPTDTTSGHVPGSVSSPLSVALGAGFGALYVDTDATGSRLYGSFWNGSGTQTASGVSMSSRFVRGRPAAVFAGSSFALAFKDSSNALVFRRFGATGSPLTAEAILATGAGGRSEVDLSFSGEEYGLAFFRGSVVSFLRVAPDGSTVGAVADVSTTANPWALGPQVQWVGSGWAMTWVDSGDIRYAFLAPDGTVLVPPIQVTFTPDQTEEGLQLVWNGQDLGLAWHEYALPDPPGGEVYFTVLDPYNGIKRFSPVVPYSGVYDDTYPAMYWDSDRFRIVLWAAEGLRETAVKPDGTLTGERKLYAVTGGRSGVAWNGATLGIAWPVEGYAGFSTSACHADATPPPCPAVTAVSNGSVTTVSWNATSDPESGLWRYSIYRDGVLLMQERPPSTSFGDGGVVPGTPHSYQVRPLSWAMQEPASCAAATPSADLSLGKSDGQATAVPGQPISYALTLTNTGPSTVTQVTLSDPLPAVLLSPLFTPSSGSYDPGTGAWTSLSLGSGQSATLTLTATLSSAATGSLSNTATVAHRGGLLVDASSSNDSSTDLDTLVPSADLSVSKSGPANASRGANASYTITVTNLGPSDAAGVSLADPTPAGLTFVGNAGDCATAFPCSLGTIPSGGSRTVTATFGIPAGYAGANPFQNTATASTSTSDPISTNNASTATTTVDASRLRTLTPCRLVDTRDPDGPYGGPPLAAGATRRFALSGRCGVPSSARALVLNATVTQPSQAGSLSFFPGGSAPTYASTINYSAGITRANNAIGFLNASSELDVVCAQAAGSVHLILDVSGYFE